MYFNKALQRSINNTKTFYDKATVILDKKDITLNYDFYTKRNKVTQKKVFELTQNLYYFIMFQLCLKIEI